MPDYIDHILSKEKLSRQDLINLLSVTNSEAKEKIFKKAKEVRDQYVGAHVHLRGLIEFSNQCRKNCLYCGVRSSNKSVNRYQISKEEVMNSVKTAMENNYTSIVIQSGEKTNQNFVNTIDEIVREIKSISNGKIGITLSCGEQSEEIYKRWFDSGAHRYLLRIESSNLDLYNSIHPQDSLHHFGNRLIALKHLRRIGYQVGSGVMIGLPNQTMKDLANDLLSLQELDVDMVGMGPFIEHADTPLYAYKDLIPSKDERLRISLLMVAVLRILMKDINIASATALDTLHPDARMMAFQAGANVLMPNLTPIKYRENYFLYEDKPFLLEANELVSKLKSKGLNIDSSNETENWGDSKHYLNRSQF